MFKVSILDTEKTALIFTEMASCVVLPGEEGEFSILDFHQPILACLKDGNIRVDKRQPIPIKRGIAKMQGSELVIVIER